MPESLILTPLQKVTESLANAIAQPKNEFIRDAVIQRFEYTYELAWKFIKCDLVDDVGSEAINGLNRKDLFRIAADKGLITDPLPWFSYHKARNETSHTYNEKIAEETYKVALQFVIDAQYLLHKLELKHA
ncbi:HI0074 family nucleotidyltransferase substrate-binding subunit [uncultured Amphritea sp.]|uniref:HI0074 family nucleotidyltransferase substrate-binding subunit n=1 Tax=uncultured Amphritea sp. TaxID=981605 RepID=UPI0026270834|nr:HI0074 family nucleotidyltransferase substrate-binding subunit [uncultured Amphritea sp.]